MSDTCKTCDGHGRVVVVRESTMYACGFIQEAKTCPDCKGCRILPPNPVSIFRRLLALVGAR